MRYGFIAPAHAFLPPSMRKCSFFSAIFDCLNLTFRYVLYHYVYYSTIFDQIISIHWVV